MRESSAGRSWDKMSWHSPSGQRWDSEACSLTEPHAVTQAHLPFLPFEQLRRASKQLKIGRRRPSCTTQWKAPYFLPYKYVIMNSEFSQCSYELLCWKASLQASPYSTQRALVAHVRASQAILSGGFSASSWLWPRGHPYLLKWRKSVDLHIWDHHDADEKTMLS